MLSSRGDCVGWEPSLVVQGVVKAGHAVGISLTSALPVILACLAGGFYQRWILGISLSPLIALNIDWKYRKRFSPYLLGEGGKPAVRVCSYRLYKGY